MKDMSRPLVLGQLRQMMPEWKACVEEVQKHEIAMVGAKVKHASLMVSRKVLRKGIHGTDRAYLVGRKE